MDNLFMRAVVLTPLGIAEGRLAPAPTEPRVGYRATLTRTWQVRLLEAGIVIGWIGGGVSGAATYFNAWLFLPAVVFSGIALLAMWCRNRLDAPSS